VAVASAEPYATRSRQITMPAPDHSVFYKLDALPAAQPTASKHNFLCKKVTKTKTDKNNLAKILYNTTQ